MTKGRRSGGATYSSSSSVRAGTGASAAVVGEGGRKQWHVAHFEELQAGRVKTDETREVSPSTKRERRG